MKVLSKKVDGSMKFTGDPQLDIQISHNRKQFLKSIGVSANLLVSAQLEHGSNVEIIRSAILTTSEVTPKVVDHTDALITNQKNIFLSITVADCLPIYLHDPSSGTIGIIHAGWKGLSKNIIQKTIMKAQNELLLDSAKTRIEIGPSIGPCHFEVKQDVVDQFKDYPTAISPRDDRTYLDLRSLAKTQLLNVGIDENNVEISPICTYEDENYFSYRRDKYNPVEAMMAVVGFRN